MNMAVGGKFDAAYDALFRLGIGLNLLLLLHLLHLLAAARSASQISMGGFLTRGIKGNSGSHWPTSTSSDFRPAAPSYPVTAPIPILKQIKSGFQKERKSHWPTSTSSDFRPAAPCHCTAAHFKSQFRQNLNQDFKLIKIWISKNLIWILF